jgi:hypothetical protein
LHHLSSGRHAAVVVAAEVAAEAEVKQQQQVAAVVVVEGAGVGADGDVACRLGCTTPVVSRDR